MKMNRRINSTYLSKELSDFEPKFMFLDNLEKSKFYIIGRNGHILKIDKNGLKADWS